VLFHEPQIISLLPAGDDTAATTAIVATLAVDPLDPLFAGHYPGFPVYPGVCLIEFVHRSVRAASAARASSPLLTAVRSTRFHSPVFPGEELTARIELTGTDGRLHAKAAVDAGERRVAAIRLEYALDGASSSPVLLNVPTPLTATAHEEILRRLPHRDPMLLVDRVTAITPGESVTALKTVTGSEPCFQARPSAGTTDGRLPAALLIESWCQAAGLLMTWDDPIPDIRSGEVMLFGSMSDMALPAPVLVGEVIEHHARLVRAGSAVYVFEGESTVAGRTVLNVGEAFVALRPADAVAAARP
jgi:3-hydroxyacyl-[acyl-carrier-protein] dehydratase